MASQDKLRAMFNEMNLEQKGNFIENLKKSLEGSDDIESTQFLDECIAHYTMEMDFMASAEAEELEAAQASEITDEITPPDVEPEVEVIADIEPEVEVIADVEPDVEVIADVEPDVEVITDIEAEAELIIDAGLEEEVMVELDPVEEVIAEPELDPVEEVTVEVDLVEEVTVEVDLVEEVITEPELDVILEAELDIEAEFVVEETSGFEPELEPEADFATEIESEEALEIEIEDEPVVESEPVDLIIEVESETELANIDLTDEIQVEDITDVAIDTDSESIAASPKVKNKVDFIEMEISELANNIRHKMRVIETISYLLSGKGSDIVEAALANESEPALPLESTSAYEEKVEGTELSLSEFAESIRHDIKVIEAISNLLSGV